MDRKENAALPGSTPSTATDGDMQAPTLGVPGAAECVGSSEKSAIFYRSLPVKDWPMADAGIAVREVGQGPALVLIHGYPVHGYTWRNLLPSLSQHHRCIVIDLPGLGSSRWQAGTDFSFTAQAQRVVELLHTQLGLSSYSLLAQDTGGTVARLVASAAGARLHRLALVNTEIPGHRPPWIPLYVRASKLPGASLGFKFFLSSRRLVGTSMGFRQFYENSRLNDDPRYLPVYLKDLLETKKQLQGMVHYLSGIEWHVVDNLEATHRKLTAPVLLIWGCGDRTFPIETARPMAEQFGGPCQFLPIPDTRLMPHEEAPETVLKGLLPFLRGGLDR